MGPRKIPLPNALFRCRYCQKCFKGVDTFIAHKRDKHDGEFQLRGSRTRDGGEKKDHYQGKSSLVPQPEPPVQNLEEIPPEKCAEIPLASISKNIPISISAPPPPPINLPKPSHQGIEDESTSRLLLPIKKEQLKLERCEEEGGGGSLKENQQDSLQVPRYSSVEQSGGANQFDMEGQEVDDDDDDVQVVAFYPSSKPSSTTSRNLLADSLSKLGLQGPLIDEEGIEVVGFVLPKSQYSRMDPVTSAIAPDEGDPEELVTVNDHDPLLQLGSTHPSPSPNVSPLPVEDNSECISPEPESSYSVEKSCIESIPSLPSQDPASLTEGTEDLEILPAIPTTNSTEVQLINLILESASPLNQITFYRGDEYETADSQVTPSQSSLTSDSGVGTNESGSDMDTEDNVWHVNGLYPSQISFLEDSHDFERSGTVDAKLDEISSSKDALKFASPVWNPPEDSSTTAPPLNAPVSDIQTLIKNMELRNTEKEHYEFKCKLCGELIAKADDIDTHLRETHESRLVYKCNMCNETFDQELALIWHSTIHYQKFDGKSKLDVDVKREHGITQLFNSSSRFPRSPSKDFENPSLTSLNSMSCQTEAIETGPSSNIPLTLTTSSPKALPNSTCSPINILSQMASSFREAQSETEPPSSDPVSLCISAIVTEKPPPTKLRRHSQAQQSQQGSQVLGKLPQDVKQKEMESSPSSKAKSTHASPRIITNPTSLPSTEVLQTAGQTLPTDFQETQDKTLDQIQTEKGFKCSYCPMVFLSKVRRHIHECLKHPLNNSQLLINASLSENPAQTASASSSKNDKTGPANSAQPPVTGIPTHSCNSSPSPAPHNPPNSTPSSSNLLVEPSTTLSPKLFIPERPLQLSATLSPSPFVSSQIFSCYNCQKTFTRLHDLIPHDNSQKVQLVCRHCLKPLSHTSTFRKHEQLHTSPIDRESNASHKQQSIREQVRTPKGAALSPHHLPLHMTEVRQEQSPLVPSLQAPQNQMMDQSQRFARGESNSEPKDRFFKCPRCPKKFKGLTCLQKHERWHQAEPYKCNICDISFTTSTNLRNHQNRHNNIHPHMCSFCPKCFASASSRSAHEKRLHGMTTTQFQKLFQPSNSASSSESSGSGRTSVDQVSDLMTNHIMEEQSTEEISSSSAPPPPESIVTSGVSYECNTSFQQLPNENSLQLHTIVHCETSRLQCALCHLQFPNSTSLRVHEISHQKGLQSSPCFQLNFNSKRHPDLLEDFQGKPQEKEKPTHPQLPAPQTFIYPSPYSTSNNNVRPPNGNNPIPRQNNAGQNNFSQAYSTQIHHPRLSTQSNSQNSYLNMFQPASQLPRLFQQNDQISRHFPFRQNPDPPQIRNFRSQPYSCLFCGKSFFNLDQLRLHEKTHQAEKNPLNPDFQCRFYPQFLSNQTYRSKQT